MIVLPDIMVAPNGARRTKADHPALPVAIPEIVDTARACYAAGAGALHAHVRDDDGRHVLDAGLYRELLDELDRQVPDMVVQITTEAVGQYTPQEQAAVVRDVQPAAISVALKEMIPDAGAEDHARGFYSTCAEMDIAVQHILYAPDDLVRLIDCAERGIVPDGDLSVLFVLGRYTPGQQSDPDSLDPFLAVRQKAGIAIGDWMVCAFGTGETACLENALRDGGKARVGFENSLWNADGSIARDNAERVKAIADIAEKVMPSPSG